MYWEREGELIGNQGSGIGVEGKAPASVFGRTGWLHGLADGA